MCYSLPRKRQSRVQVRGIPGCAPRANVVNYCLKDKTLPHQTPTADQNLGRAKERQIECKVYYEDTDCMSVVYHANYLKYLERGRSEYVESRLCSVADYHNRGYLFMVHKVEIVFHGPARLGETLVVRTWIENTTRYRVVVKQIIIKKGEPRDYLVTATVTLVAVGPDGQLKEIPAEFHEL
jgi:acyl-CoA thioester hydrolase